MDDSFPDLGSLSDGELKGARHDDSVLFSLSSLQALASSSKEPARAVQTTAGEGGSGLIDIRSLQGGAPSGPSASTAKAEDIFSMGGGGFGQPIGIPSLLQPTEKKSNTLLYVLGGVGGFAVLAVIVLVVLVFGLGIGRQPAEEQTGKQLNEEELKAKLLAELQKSGMANTQPSGTQLTGTQPSENTQAGTEEGSEEEEVGADGTKKKGGKKKKGAGGEEAAGETEEEETGSGDKTSKAADDLLSLIDKATSKEKGGAKETTKTTPKVEEKTTTAPAELPSTPSKNDVLSAMKKVTGKVKACAKGQTGKAVTSIVFSGSSGKATSAKVIGGEFAGTPAASCIAGAAQSASVPKFKQSSFSVTYPFVVK